MGVGTCPKCGNLQRMVTSAHIAEAGIFLRTKVMPQLVEVHSSGLARHPEGAALSLTKRLPCIERAASAPPRFLRGRDILTLTKRDISTSG
jgi:uncharacterized protein (UPF0212 family)